MLNDVPKRMLRSSETTEADVREDEEQTTKYEEIIDLLVAAGYFRARIKGLSNFDKVIGGMTWCIESCNFDVDVDLLFRENLTIGQRIALTEKIVVMLPKMNCPYRIEPHQIQGLDCIHIFPVIQWLVKRSMETRQEKAGFVREFALSQFRKRHSFSEDVDNVTAAKEALVRNIRAVKKAYEPRRLYKHRDDVAIEESTRFLGTLLEYGESVHVVSEEMSTSTSGTAPSSEVNSSEPTRVASNEKKITTAQEASVSEKMAVIEESGARLSANVAGNIVGIQAQETAKAIEKYANMSTSETENATVGSSRASTALQQQRTTLQSRVRKLTKERDSLSEKLSELTAKTSEFRSKREALERSFEKAQEIGLNDNNSVAKRLEELLSVHDGLKEQERSFREQCKADLNVYQNMLREVEGASTPAEEEDRMREYEEQKEFVSRARLQLAKKNRAIASLTRQLDDVPGRSELTQYQRRFMELYNQVSAKHKETKQYYTLYNTLDDTKLYLSKELSLLNSIQDNYNEAMASASGKEQFLKQFEAIVAGIKRNKQKVEKRCADEKARRDALSRQLVTLIDQQRKYVVAVRQLTIECRKNEALLVQLRGP